MLYRHNEGTQVRVIIGYSFVNTISTEKYSFGPSDNRYCTTAAFKNRRDTKFFLTGFDIASFLQFCNHW